MSARDAARNGVQQARGVLHEMIGSCADRSACVRTRLEDLMATLDLVLGSLDANAPDSVMDYVDHIVTNLHSAELALRQEGPTGAGMTATLRWLQLAEGRVVRLRDLLADCQ